MKLWKLAVTHTQDKSIAATHLSDLREQLSSSQPELNDPIRTVQVSEMTLISGQGNKDATVDVFGSLFYIIVATQFGPRDDSFGRLQLCNLLRATECLRICTNRTIVTSQMDHHVI